MPKPTEPISDEPLSLSIRSSREAALRVLEEHRATGMWVSDLLDRVFRESGLPAKERGLATELACGVVRRQATLDAILKTLIARPADQVEISLWTILRLGVYQILFLDGIPPHAAVHETVELCKRAGRMRWSGFVNGVLRGATRLTTTQYTTEPSDAAVPLSDGRHRKLTKPVFFDPKSDFPAYLASAYSMPLWLTERWVKRFTSEQLLRLCQWFNTSPPLTIRTNTLRSNPADVLRIFREAGIAIEPQSDSDTMVVEGVSRVDQLPGYAEGLFFVQDFSAGHAAARLAPQPGQRVWDVCAAPGGKTCHLAAIMQNQGEILATDIRSDRLEIVNDNARRLGAEIIRTQLVDEEGYRLPQGPFHAILVDVPCSNTGVLGKRPEARWRITPDGIESLKGIQENLLGKSLERLAPQGRLVYSTCSIEPNENQEIVRKILTYFPNVRLAEEQQFLPGEPGDGAYQALLIKD
ncbi:16S rRNA (cytosine(967)-C(5))-methyltransferase RsmB [Schlesneria sp.]|uniref:16S rRNA (cytosine(967)-C(5))-methyltransferase RsmB n=1 Tax=Schlesneria sp. TaxID=2762018 RepID=UPI002EDF485C